jgi:hypothetical protein
LPKLSSSSTSRFLDFIARFKVYEAEDVELLKGLAAKIKSEVNFDGLVWG